MGSLATTGQRLITRAADAGGFAAKDACLVLALSAYVDCAPDGTAPDLTCPMIRPPDPGCAPPFQGRHGRLNRGARSGYAIRCRRI